MVAEVPLTGLSFGILAEEVLLHGGRSFRWRNQLCPAKTAWRRSSGS